MHKSDRRLYVDANDQVVEADDPTRVKLLVGKGGELPMEEARRYGLAPDAHDAPTAQQKPSETKGTSEAPKSADKPSGKKD